MIRAYVARNLMQAHLIRGFLDSEGIFSVVRGEHLVAIQGEVPITMDTLPSIWVNEVDRDTARALIERALRGELVFKDWVCPVCSETVEGQFTECWQCGTARAPV